MTESDDGIVYSAFIDEQVNAEMARRTSIDARGTAVVTISGALITLVLAIGSLALVKGATVAGVAKVGVAVALAFFVAAAIMGILASFLHNYEVASGKTLDGMVQSHWGDDTSNARRSCAYLQTKTAKTLRSGNNTKARQLTIALILQVCAVAFLGLAVSWEFWH